MAEQRFAQPVIHFGLSLIADGGGAPSLPLECLPDV